MNAWLNFFCLLFATLFFLYFYVRSVSPAGRAQVIGARAYQQAFHDRMAAMGFELLITANFILARFLPLPPPLPRQFPWTGGISIALAALIGIPAAALMLVGMRHAGRESLRPHRDQTMYTGIYTRIRHPQAVGEVFLFPALALLLNSPFLLLFSLVYFPVFMIMCHAEEQDLLIRYGQPYAAYMRSTGAFFPRSRQRG